MTKISVIDSHTGGEPTRVVVAGGPEMGRGSVADRLQIFREKYDNFRSAVVNEPRGSDVLVGALLVEPRERGCAAGVIFFNNVGYLGMCGHGTIGLIATLAHMGRIGPGEHRIETPVGVVTAILHGNGEVSVENVPSWRERKSVSIKIGTGQIVKGDVAWGGNWFFLLEEHGQEISEERTEQLTEYCWKLRQAVNAQGFPLVDHIELFAPSRTTDANSVNFVLCPGKAYDRSPCGTGTSAKLACLAAEGKLKENEIWQQESIIGSTFKGSFRWLERAAGKVIPVITGRAFINAESALLLDEADPFCWGICHEPRV
jgi:4-hydroxyproline epimerase